MLPPMTMPDAPLDPLGVGGGMMPEAAVIQREAPEPEAARADLVQKLLKTNKQDEVHHSKAFARMRADMDFAAGKQYDGQTDDDDRYLINVVFQHLRSRVNALYARNPKVYAKRRPKLDYVLWDEKPETLLQAQGEYALWEKARMDAEGGGQQFMVPPPAGMALLQEVNEVKQRHMLMDRMGKTLQFLHQHETAAVFPSYKESLKQLVRRVGTTGVGWVRQGYQRLMEPRPNDATELTDLSQRLMRIETLMADQQDGKTTEYQAEAEQLRGMLKDLQAQEMVLVREGVTWDFPASTAVIPDAATRLLKGLVGCRWLTEKFLMTPEAIKEKYKVDLTGGSYTRYNAAYTPTADLWTSGQTGEREDLVCVYMMTHKLDGMVYLMAEGHNDFLIEPAPPEVEVDGFWLYRALTFNDLEHEKQLFPPSDVHLLRHPQRELNRTGEARRQHRIANRPLYLAVPGFLEEDDAKSMANAEAHDVLVIKGLQPGSRVEDYVAPVKKIPYDPNLYETATLHEDIMRAGGQQEATVGPISNGGSATEASIAEGSRISSVESNRDDLNGLLQAMALADSQIMLREYSEETVKRIVGPGAVWPTLTRQEIIEQVYLDIEAGSSGRPNKAQELANLERVGPMLMQIPGITPQWLAKYTVNTLDDRIDLAEAFIDGMPSITGLNAQARPGTGDPATDPNQQGGQGGQNAKQPDRPPERDGAAFPAGDGAQAGGQIAGRQ